MEGVKKGFCGVLWLSIRGLDLEYTPVFFGSSVDRLSRFFRVLRGMILEDRQNFGPPGIEDDRNEELFGKAMRTTSPRLKGVINIVL